MSTTDEVLVPGAIPRWEVPGWQERFGITAGITGRGADLAVPFDLGLWTSQPAGQVMARWRQVRASFRPQSTMVLAHQVHGSTVRWHGDHSTPGGWILFEGFDGHATATPGVMLLVTVADCVPIYLAAPGKGAVALLHAGWRGTAGGIVERGLQVLHQHVGAAPNDVVMHCGVAICGPCYEVGPEVLEAVGRGIGTGGNDHLDLREALSAQAHQLGVGEVTRSGHCTSCERDRFFSHRGSGGTDGRMVAWLGIDPR